MDVKTGALSSLNRNIEQINQASAAKRAQSAKTPPGMDPRQNPPVKVRDESAIIGLTVDTKV